MPFLLFHSLPLPQRPTVVVWDRIQKSVKTRRVEITDWLWWIASILFTSPNKTNHLLVFTTKQLNLTYLNRHLNLTYFIFKSRKQAVILSAEIQTLFSKRYLILNFVSFHVNSKSLTINQSILRSLEVGLVVWMQGCAFKKLLKNWFGEW